MKNGKSTSARDRAVKRYYKKHFAEKEKFRRAQARRPFAEKILESLMLYRELEKFRKAKTIGA